MDDRAQSPLIVTKDSLTSPSIHPRVPQSYTSIVPFTAHHLGVHALRLLACIVQLHYKLTALPALTPSPLTTATMENLFIFVTKMPDYLDVQGKPLGQLSPKDVELVLEMPQVQVMAQDIRDKFCEAESVLEQGWAQQTIYEGAKLSDFKYLRNYKLITSTEYYLSVSLGMYPKNVLFLGSGPLPVSGLVLAEDLIAPDMKRRGIHDWSVVNVDIDAEANKIASKVASVLFPQLRDHVKFVTCDAIDAPELMDIGKFDVVFLASLVGQDTTDKRKILEAVVPRMRPGAFVVMRSAQGLRRILYPQVDLHLLLGDEHLPLKVMAEVNPYNDIVNSAIFLRRT